MGYMKTTLEIPDALFRKAKATAALRGQSLKELVNAALEQVLDGSSSKTTKSMEKWLQEYQVVGKKVAIAWRSKQCATDTISEMRR